MAADTLKSASITNLDASPVVANTTGIGAPAMMHVTADYVTPTTGGLGSTSSIYKMVRVPTTVKIKEIRMDADAALDSNGSPTLAVDVGLYYSDSTVDGTTVANQGTVINDNLFADNVLFGAATTRSNQDMTSNFGQVKRQQPLWQAAGLASDPGGAFDIVVTVEATAATAVSTNMGLEARWTF